MAIRRRPPLALALAVLLAVASIASAEVYFEERFRGMGADLTSDLCSGLVFLQFITIRILISCRMFVYFDAISPFTYL